MPENGDHLYHSRLYETLLPANSQMWPLRNV
jgi:hypothetical protein